MSELRKQPIRTCIACRSTSDKRQMMRFVRTAEGRVEYDTTGKRAGRGAYLCDGNQCFSVARKRRLLEKALRTSMNDEDYQRLQTQFEILNGDAVHGLGMVN